MPPDDRMNATARSIAPVHRGEGGGGRERENPSYCVVEKSRGLSTLFPLNGLGHTYWALIRSTFYWANRPSILMGIFHATTAAQHASKGPVYSERAREGRREAISSGLTRPPQSAPRDPTRRRQSGRVKPPGPSTRLGPFGIDDLLAFAAPPPPPVPP